jgi:hypothetical protein
MLRILKTLFRRKKKPTVTLTCPHSEQVKKRAQELDNRVTKKLEKEYEDAIHALVLGQGHLPDLWCRYKCAKVAYWEHVGWDRQHRWPSGEPY